MLLDGAVEALRQGCSRVVWAIHCGDDLDAMATAVDEARLVSHILGLATPERPATARGGRQAGVRIETPLVDLTDSQLAELAHDLDAPLGAAWWCEAEGEAACGRCEACRRWTALATRVTSSPAGRAEAEDAASGPRAGRSFPTRG